MSEKEDRQSLRRSHSIQRLEKSALDLLSSKSYSAIRVEDITSRAGLSKGSLYLYFRDKSDLFQRTLRKRLFEPMGSFLDDLMRQADPGKVLAELVVYSMEQAHRELDMAMIYRSMMDKALIELLREDLRAFDEKYFGAGERLFGALGVSEPRTRTMLLFALLDGLGMYRCLEVDGPEFWKNEASSRALSRAILDLFGLGRNKQ